MMLLFSMEKNIKQVEVLGLPVQILERPLQALIMDMPTQLLQADQLGYLPNNN